MRHVAASIGRRRLLAWVVLAVACLSAPASASASPFTPGPTLGGTGESGAGGFGTSIAVSSDGTTAVVGAPLDDGGVGAAFVFTRSASTWTQDGPKLTGAGEQGAAHFGAAVSVSADGMSILVGAPLDSSGAGAVWAFRRTGTSLSQEGAPLRGGEETGAGEFGAALALSADGETALVGGPGDDALTGAVWAFALQGGEWSQQGAKLVSSHSAPGAEAGSSVALSAGGDRALVGAPRPEGQGAVYSYAREAGAWSEGPALAAPWGDAEQDRFGASVALSDDGTAALVGAPGTTVPPLEAHEETEDRGVAWTFQWNGSTWSQHEELEAEHGGEEVWFGEFVAVSADGATAVVAEPGWGRAQVFRREPNGWWKRGTDLLGEGSVALSGDASLALTGEPRGPGLARSWELSFGPFVQTGSGALEVTASSATVRAHVDPEGHEVTECEVEYGTTALTASAPCRALPGAGNGLVEVSAHLAGLQPHTNYRYRFRASSGAGFEAGATWFFTTLAPSPVVSTGSVTAIGETTATLGGTVNPNGLQVSDCRFEYGTTEAYGSNVPCGGEPGAGNSPQPVSAALTALIPGQAYHYRLRATNSSGTSYGQDSQFEAATAALPEFGVCSPAGGAEGAYSDKGCVKPVAGRGGKYGWQPWPAGPQRGGREHHRLEHDRNRVASTPPLRSRRARGAADGSAERRTDSHSHGLRSERARRKGVLQRSYCR